MKILKGLASIVAIIPLEAALVDHYFIDGKNIPEIFEYGESYDYFRTPGFNEDWDGKIKEWQSRANKESFSFVKSGPSLREEYLTYLKSSEVGEDYKSRLSFAKGLADWTQEVAPKHYISDGSIDHWATLEETLEGNGDDCDGLSALPYNALIMKGFPSNQIYYGLIRNKYNGSHHMVTFWFDKSVKNNNRIINYEVFLKKSLKKFIEYRR